MNAFTDSKTEKVAEIIRQLYKGPIRRLLVVGCGSGVEAAILARELKADVTGIDMEEAFDQDAARLADLRPGDATAMGFDDESFDFVFSYHALEHISDPHAALREIHRVLRDGGGFWIGTPNRRRLLGYIGSKEGKLSDKIRWNLHDYRARLSGRFRNEYGAHAGFSADELRSMLSAAFREVNEASDIYFDTIYRRHAWALKAAKRFRNLLYPSVYFIGRK